MNSANHRAMNRLKADCCLSDSRKKCFWPTAIWAVSLVVTVSLSGACKRGSSEKKADQVAAPQVYRGDTLPAYTTPEPNQFGGTLTVAVGTEPRFLNHQLDPLDAWGRKINMLIMESLARVNHHNWEHEARLAESWSISDDKLTFTFKLRQNVLWHDGQPFSADDVIFTFDKILDPTSRTIATRSYLAPLVSYEKIDQSTVVFHLSTPYWLAFDAIAEIVIYPKHIYAKGDFNTHPANRAPIGTGQFKFEHWKTGDEIVLKRNPDYFAQKAYLETLVFKYIADPTVRLHMLRNGQVDVIENVSPEEWRTLTADPSIAENFWRLRHVPSSLQWIGWNQDRPFFADAQVRRALTMLIDRRDVVDNLRLGLDTIAESWFYPGTKEHDPSQTPLPYNPKEAENLLQKAGWQDSNGDGIRDKDGIQFEFTFLYPAGPPFYEQLAGLLKTDLRRAGINVNTARVEWAVYTERLRKHEFDACSLLWQMTPRNDPYQVWHSSEVNGGSNFISFQNPEVDQILVTARQEFDETKRIALYRKFNQILREQQPYTMLFNRHNLSIISKKFGGVISTPNFILSYGDFFMHKPAVTRDEDSAPELRE